MHLDERMFAVKESAMYVQLAVLFPFLLIVSCSPVLSRH